MLVPINPHQRQHQSLKLEYQRLDQIKHALLKSTSQMFIFPTTSFWLAKPSGLIFFGILLMLSSYHTEKPLAPLRRDNKT
jgi:hypothetical protein